MTSNIGAKMCKSFIPFPLARFYAELFNWVNSFTQNRPIPLKNTTYEWCMLFNKVVDARLHRETFAKQNSWFTPALRAVRRPGLSI